MKTTYYLVAAAAVAAAGVTIYARITGDEPHAPARQAKAAEAPRDMPRLALPPVSVPPDEPEPPAPAPLPLTSQKPEKLAMPQEVIDSAPTPVKLVSASEPPIAPPPTMPALPTVPTVPAMPAPPPVPTAPAVPAVPVIPSTPAPKPDASPVPDVVPKLDVPPVPVTPPALPLPKPNEVSPSVPAPFSVNVPPAPVPVQPNAKTPAVPPISPAPVPPKPAAPVLQPPVAPTPVSVAAPKPLPPLGEAPARPATAPPTDAGKYVILTDDKLIEASGVSVEGDTLLVRQGVLDRPFPQSKVQFVASSRDEVYKFMLAKVPADDAAARLGVAKWCMFSGLREQALAEAREVQKLQPGSTAAADMVRSLELSLKQFPPAGAPKMAAPEPPSFPAELRTPEPPATEPEPDVTPEAALVFGSRVQPFLANQCVSCHAKPDHAGAFKLARVAPADAGPQVTRTNLRAVAAQLKKDDPGASPLLTRTLSAHGGMKLPAVSGRESVAYRAIEAWVALAVGTPIAPPMPAPQPPVMPQAVATPAPVPMPDPASVGSSDSAPPTPAAVPVLPLPDPVPVLPSTPAPPVAPPAVPAPVALPKATPALPLPPVEIVPSAPALAPPPTPKPLPPAIPPIPADDIKPKPLPVPIPPAEARAKPPATVTPAGGTKFGEAKPTKPPVTGPSGDEFDPAGFNQPGK